MSCRVAASPYPAYVPVVVGPVSAAPPGNKINTPPLNHPPNAGPTRQTARHPVRP